MTYRWLAILALALPSLVVAQTGRGPHARIAVLRPHNGHIVDFEAGFVRRSAKAFEAALGAGKPALQSETLWYRMVAGGVAPRYVRLRPRPSLAAVLDARGEQALPDRVTAMIAKMTVEILNLRPTMSLGVPAPARD